MTLQLKQIIHFCKQKNWEPADKNTPCCQLFPIICAADAVTGCQSPLARLVQDIKAYVTRRIQRPRECQLAAGHPPQNNQLPVSFRLSALRNSFPSSSSGLFGGGDGSCRPKLQQHHNAAMACKFFEKMQISRQESPAVFASSLNYQAGGANRTHVEIVPQP